jgi:hypothetical protein
MRLDFCGKLPDHFQPALLSTVLTPSLNSCERVSRLRPKSKNPGLFLFDISGKMKWSGASAMTYRGHIRNGQVLLDEPARLPEGAEVNVDVVEKMVRITRPQERQRLAKFQPIEMPGGSLADELIWDRR